jgi:hypothetical protein
MPCEIIFERLVESQRDFHLNRSRRRQKMMTSRISETANAVILASENRSACPKIVSKAASLSMKIILGGRDVLTQEKKASPIIEKSDIR